MEIHNCIYLYPPPGITPTQIQEEAGQDNSDLDQLIWYKRGRRRILGRSGRLLRLCMQNADRCKQEIGNRTIRIFLISISSLGGRQTLLL